MVPKRLKTHYLRSNEQSLDNRVYSFIFETKHLTKNAILSSKSQKNTKNPKMVSKQLKTRYLRSYEQFLENRIYKCIFETKNLTKKCNISAESPKILKVQKWCQNGSKPII